jgi:hypothetical protein
LFVFCLLLLPMGGEASSALHALAEAAACPGRLAPPDAVWAGDRGWVRPQTGEALSPEEAQAASRAQQARAAAQAECYLVYGHGQEQQCAGLVASEWRR